MMVKIFTAWGLPLHEMKESKNNLSAIFGEV